MQKQATERPAPAWDLAETRRIVTSMLADHQVRIYLFGSRAAGTANRYSDIDVAIDVDDELPRDLLPRIREALEESQIVYNVDLVDLRSVSEALRTKIFEEGVTWIG